MRNRQCSEEDWGVGDWGAKGRYKAYINNAPLMTGEDEIALQILVPVAFVERARGDKVLAFDADVLREDGVAVEGEEGDVRGAAQHDCAVDVIDAGALGGVSDIPIFEKCVSHTSTGFPPVNTRTNSRRLRSHRST